MVVFGLITPDDYHDLLSDLEDIPSEVPMQIGPFSKQKAVELVAQLEDTYARHTMHPLSKVLLEVFDVPGGLGIGILLRQIEALRPFDTVVFGQVPCYKMKAWTQALLEHLY